MLERNCVHCFTYQDLNLVVDGNSGAIHLVDDSALKLITWLKREQEITTLAALKDYYQTNQAQQGVLAEIIELVEEGLLFSPEITDLPTRPPTVVKALCLNVAHDCNLRCQYCFASTGDFGGGRELMPLETALKSVDFLLQGSGQRRQLEIDFFGGEPLLNWPVVKETVLYGQRQAQKLAKIFRFTVTTNGIGLTPEITNFINEEMYNVVLSLDGRPEINDHMRQTISGKGSAYETIVPKFQRLVRGRGNKSYFVRGTFTAFNLDFATDVEHLSDLGFEQISMEPVVADSKYDYALQNHHLPAVLQEYERLTEAYLKRQGSTGAFDFFHFNVELKKGPCLYKRLTGCGAGYEYLAVAPNGDLYPCHQFVGEVDYRLGTVWTGVENQELPKLFQESHVLNKPDCQICWAKYYCSGGCHKNNMEYAGNILSPHELSCILEKKRLECAFFLQAKLGA